MSFSPQSSVWIYQSNRQFTANEATEINRLLVDFINKWTAHGKQLKAKAELLYNTFIVITVDEQVAEATGCSIDASVREMKKIEQAFGVDLFNRYNLAYKTDNGISILSKEDFETLIVAKKIDNETIVFNNMVQTLAEMQTKWEVPLKHSWHHAVFATHLAN